MSIKAEEYIDAGLALVQLGRLLQKVYPKVENEGSQFDEDKILAELLPGKGIYVDVGANHPKECSNTWRLYQRGWRGMLIEPLPDAWPALLLERREDRLCPVAASNRDGFATLRVCRSVSSLRDDWKINAEDGIIVRTATLSTILSMYGNEFDFSKTQLLSIDVEGHEKEVLEGMPDWFRPDVIVLEYRDYDPANYGKDISDGWKRLLVHWGYRKHHENPLNQIWKRK